MKARILVIEDSPTQAKSIVEMLEDTGFSAFWAEGGVQGLKMARIEEPDLILLDVMMDDMDGYSVCRWLKVHEATKNIPVIMLTVKGEVEDRVEGLNVGADDYLPKPFNESELEARIYAALRSKMAREKLKKRNAELEEMFHKVEYMAMTDALTSLYNRRRFCDVLYREFASAKRYDNHLSCIMMDIDHFKNINDQYGHPAGDEVLKEIAMLLLSILREVDLAARYGGEEFSVLLPHTSKESAKVAADRIMNAIRRSKIDIGTQKFYITVSMGIASVEDIDSGDAEELIRCADAALYDAKKSGRDQIVIYSTAMSIPPEE